MNHENVLYFGNGFFKLSKSGYFKNFIEKLFGEPKMAFLKTLFWNIYYAYGNKINFKNPHLYLGAFLTIDKTGKYT